MEIEAPTFSRMNNAQKRALVLRDQLRYVDKHHLDSYIEGITDDEPPTYKNVNGTILPPLTLVTLKDTAIRLDLGNVIFSEDKKDATHHAYLTFENGRYQIRTEDAIPVDEDDQNSLAIHSFIATAMLPLFKQKFQAIFARKERINAARTAAYSAPSLAQIHFEEGETLARLGPSRAGTNGEASTCKNVQFLVPFILDKAIARFANKRQPGEAISRHVCNKHKRSGLDTIPKDTKCAIFNTIPNKMKVDLFNTIMKIAMPNFDNLMMASWNVVSVYSACGSDFPELHKVIVELKHVLQEIDNSFEDKGKKSDMPFREDFVRPIKASTNGSNGTDGTYSSAQTTAQNSAGLANQDITATNGSSQQVEDVGVVDTTNTADMVIKREDILENDMPPARIPQLTQPDTDEEEQGRKRRRLGPHRSYFDDRHQLPSSPRYVSDPRTNNNHSQSAHSSSTLTPLPREHAKMPRDSNGVVSVEDCCLPVTNTPGPSPELARRREEYASSIRKTHLNTTSSTAPAPSRSENSSSSSEESEPEYIPHNRPLSTPIPPSPSTTPAPPNSTPLAGTAMKTAADYTTAELRNKYAIRKANLIRTHGSKDKIPSNDVARLRQMEGLVLGREQADRDEMALDRRQSAGAGTNVNLGNSMLGAKKTVGVAPVAPMLHTRKDSGGRDNSSSSNGSGGLGGFGSRGE